MTMAEQMKPIAPLSMDILRREQLRIGGQIRNGALHPIGPFLSALRPLEPAADLHRRWHVVQVKPQQEVTVAEELKEAHLDVFAPVRPQRIRVSAIRHRIAMRPMLPGYLFAGFDAEHERWDTIRDMRGVLRVLMLDHITGDKSERRPIPILQAVIDHLRKRELDLAGRGARKHPAIALIKGALVRVLEPVSFAGLFGHIVGINHQAHSLCVEIDMFGRLVPSWLLPEQVEAM